MGVEEEGRGGSEAGTAGLSENLDHALATTANSKMS